MKRHLPLAALVALLATMALPATPMVATTEPQPPEPIDAGSVYCEWTGEDYRRVEVPAGADDQPIALQRGELDRLPGEQVPNLDGPGKFLDVNCEPVSWLEGVTFLACATPSDSARPCLSSASGNGLTYDPAENIFPADTAVVANPDTEFVSADGAVEADFDGDHLAVTVAPGQPAMDFVFGFGDWDLWEFYTVDEPTLEVTQAEAGVGAFFLQTGSTEGASEPQTVTYRLVMEHTAGLSPLRETTITVEPATLPADGVSTAEVTIQLRDPIGQPPPEGEQHEVELFMNASYGTITDIVDHGNGLYTATLTAGTTPGKARVVALVDYLDLDLTVGTVELVAP